MSTERLDRIETAIESLAQRDMERGHQIDLLFQALHQTNETQRSMLDSMQGLSNSLQRLTNAQEALNEWAQQQFARQQELIESLAAAEERQERILDYLMRRVEER